MAFESPDDFGVSYDNFSFSCGSVTYGGAGNNYFTYYASTIYSSISYVEFYYYQDGSYHLDWDGSGNTKFYLNKSSYPYTASMTTYGWRTLSYSYSVSIQCKFYLSNGTVYTTLTSSVTFPATTVNYTLSYNKNGATSGSAPDSQTVSSGSTATLRTNTGNMAKTGYYPDGWATSTTGSKAYDFGGRYTVSSNAVFYAHWVARTYTVTANPNGGDLSNTPGWSISNNIGTKTVTYDSTYGAFCSVGRTGYSLKGWYTAASSGTKIETSTKVALTDDQTIYAQWTANTYKVSFDKNGGTGSMSDQTFTYDTPQKLTANSFTKTGYSFAGWATSASGSVQYSDKESVTNLAPSGTITLYAKWTANTYKVTLNKNGGSGGNNSVDIVYDTVAGSYPSIGTLPTKTGYRFNGYWTTADGGTQYYDGSGTSVRTFDIASNTTFYAHWTPITYTIKYVGNGNTSGTMSDTSATYDVSVKLRKNAFEKTNYDFLHWLYNNNTYADEQSVSNLTTTNNATVNMTAQWRGKPSTVSFSSNGTIEATKTVYFAEAYGTLHTPTSRGDYWKFMGWYTGTNGSGTKITETTVVNVTANSTLYAYWVEIQNTFVKVNGVWKNATPNGNRFIYVNGLGWKTIKEIRRREGNEWKINKNKDN